MCKGKEPLCAIISVLFPAWDDASWTSQKQFHASTGLCSTQDAHTHQLLLAADSHTNCNFGLQEMEINAIIIHCHVDLGGSVNPPQAFRTQQRKIRRSRPREHPTLRWVTQTPNNHQQSPRRGGSKSSFSSGLWWNSGQKSLAEEILARP